jgi:hypothetical protein
MHRRGFNRAVLTILPVILSATGYLQAQAPEINIPDTSLSGVLTDRDRNAIEHYIRYWTDFLKGTDKESDVIKARDALAAGYGRYASSNSYQDYYADAAGRIATEPLRNRPARLGQVKEVNVAMFLAEMRRVFAQDALETMVAHANPAVRYFGWSAYRAIRTDILALTLPGRKLLASLRNSGAAEQSSMVAEEIFRNLAAPAATAIPIPEQRLMEIRKELLGVFRACWLPWCRQVLGGSSEAAASCRVGVSTLLSFAELVEKDKSAKTSALQMAADLLWCSSKAYQDAKGAGPIAQANAPLLEQTESALSVLMGKPQKLITETLRNEKLAPDEKADEVRRHALDLIEQLQSLGAKNPSDTFKPAAQTQPTTGPGR